MNIVLLILDIIFIGVSIVGLVIPEKMYNKGNELDPKKRRTYIISDIVCIAVLAFAMIFCLIPSLGQ